MAARSLTRSAVAKAPVPVTTGLPLRAGGARVINPGDGRLNLMKKYGAIGTLFGIVSTRAEAIAQVEWELTRTNPRNKAERIPVESHLALDVWNKPNKFTNRHTFVTQWSQHVDLVGEAFIMPATLNGMAGAPVELWQVRPDRMNPIPHPTEFLLGWEYQPPDGQAVIKLGHEQVDQFRLPNPVDPHRGIGPVQALLVDLDSSQSAAAWNNNFFQNSAEPGGIIEAAEGLSDDEFNQLSLRWNQQHRGVNNAHRVAVIEHGKWVPRAFSMRDMQFAELRNVSRDMIREAFAISKVMLGIGENVNRATAEAAWAIYLQMQIKPRLSMLRWWLNNQYLPRFGQTARGLQFDFVDPVPEDREAANAERSTKVTAAVALVAAGFDPTEVLEAMGLPAMTFTGRSNNGIDPVTAARFVDQLMNGQHDPT